jgi:hypothetical protein
MYKASSQQAAPSSGPSDASSGGTTAGAGQKKEGEVIDAEYVDVDDKK